MKNEEWNITKDMKRSEKFHFGGSFTLCGIEFSTRKKNFGTLFSTIYITEGTIYVYIPQGPWEQDFMWLVRTLHQEEDNFLLEQLMM